MFDKFTLRFFKRANSECLDVRVVSFKKEIHHSSALKKQLQLITAQVFIFIALTFVSMIRLYWLTLIAEIWKLVDISKKKSDN